MKLTNRQIALVKGLLAQGQRQHDIAALFGVNGGRIADVSTGKVGADIEPATGRLPPVGISPFELRHAIANAVADLSIALSSANPLDGYSRTLIDGVRGNLAAALAGELPKQRKRQ